MPLCWIMNLRRSADSSKFRSVGDSTEVVAISVSFVDRTVSQNYIDPPSDNVLIDYIYIDDIRYIKAPLPDVLEGKNENIFCDRDTKIYIYPTPASALDYTIYYRKEHPASVTTILLSNAFQEAAEAYVTARVFGKYGIEDNGDGDGRLKQEQIYERELAKAISTLPMDTFICEGRKR